MPKKNTVRAYEAVLSKFCQEFGSKNLDEITSDHVLSFLNKITEGTKQQTKRTRYSHISAFFNFIRNNIDQNLHNPCDTPMMKKLFRNKGMVRWNTIEKDTIDEIIFKTSKPRNRLILELMARGGMRIGEVLKLTSNDINEKKLTLRDPKSGREQEFVFIPQKVADRLRDYVKEHCVQPDQRVFPICYEAARAMVEKAGDMVGIKLRPHDLRRHAATHASRSGVPVEIVSKVILRHANLSTTQRYLGKVSDVEAMRWIDNLYS
ncbi:MAG: site-specific integrase [Desulfobacteraceae bacterium]|nr:site-specific integrase [Desulfobacteraceae bacterium]